MIQIVKNLYIANPDKTYHCYEITYDDGTKVYCPLNTNNRHYQEVQQWVADGNTIQEAD